MNFRALRDWLADLAHAAVCIPSSKPCSRMVPTYGPAILRLTDAYAKAKSSVNAETPIYDALTIEAAWIDAAVEDFAAEIAAVADDELAELVDGGWSE